MGQFEESSKTKIRNVGAGDVEVKKTNWRIACTVKTKRSEKDIKASAKVLRKCSAFNLILLWQPKSVCSLLYLERFSRYRHFCVLHFL